MIAAFAFLVAAATLSQSDRAFVEQALTGNTSEIRQGNVFADSSDPLVRDYAQRITTDHSEANTQLIALADARGMHVGSDQSPNVPYPSSTHDAWLTAQQKAKQMAGLPPVAFFTQQVRVHQQAIALYEHEIASGADRQVVAYAKGTLPALRAHLALAQADLSQERAQHHG
jgi:putative membrane protein